MREREWTGDTCTHYLSEGGTDIVMVSERGERVREGERTGDTCTHYLSEGRTDILMVSERGERESEGTREDGRHMYTLFE